MTPSALAPCIYCRIPSVPSREHVLASSLGGNLTTLSSTPFKPVVCEHCNKQFSKIDLALARCSTVALARIGKANPDRAPVRLGGDQYHYDEKNGVWLECELRTGVKLYLPPQFHLKSNGRLFLTGTSQDEMNAFVRNVSNRHRSGALSSTRIKIAPRHVIDSSCLVLHDRTLFVRASDAPAANEFLSLLERDWPEYARKLDSNTPTVGAIAQPEVEVRLEFHMDTVYRAIAKTAFTFMAVNKGSEFALRSEFDPIRDYIRGIDIRHPSDPGPEEVAVDTRFVDEWPPDAPPLVSTDYHVVGLFYSVPILFGLLTLYGTVSYVVRLAEIDLEEYVTIFHEFSTDGSWNAPLDTLDLARRLASNRQ